MRTLIIGDVHGCIDELDEMLTVLDANPRKDRIIFIGDLVNKGPDSRAVYERFRELEAESILGNHEFRLLEQAADRRQRNGGYKALKREFGSKLFRTFLDDIRTWPSYLEEDELMVVHAGIVPGLHPKKTDPDVLVNIRTWDGEGKNLQGKDNPPWFDFYHEDRLIVFGHWAALGGVVRQNVIGLDTGCVLSLIHI